MKRKHPDMSILLHGANSCTSTLKWMALFALITSAIPQASAVQITDKEPPSITVDGKGKVKTKPDLATINFGVLTRAPQAVQAIKENNQAMNALQKTLASQDIAQRDIQTNRFAIRPLYVYTHGEPAKITGYEVFNQVFVKVHDLSKMGQLIDEVVQSGANQVNGIDFSVGNMSKILDGARASALEDAHRKALLYADAAGITLGKPLHITEVSARSPHNYRGLAFFQAKSAEIGPTPILSGEEELEADVNVAYAIE